MFGSVAATPAVRRNAGKDLGRAELLGTTEYPRTPRGAQIPAVGQRVPRIELGGTLPARKAPLRSNRDDAHGGPRAVNDFQGRGDYHGSDRRKLVEVRQTRQTKTPAAVHEVVV
jgi:hypothetical protein